MPKIFSSISTKIIVIALLGILGICLIAGFNKYIENSNQKNIQISTLCQKISKKITDSLLLEERFINTSDNNILKIYSENIFSIDSDINAVKSISSEKGILNLLEKMGNTVKEHSEIFDKASKNILALKKNKTDIANKLYSLTQHLNEMVAAIDYEESIMMMDGVSIEYSTNSMRIELKTSIISYYEILLNINDLLFYQDLETFNKKKTEVYKLIDAKLKNISPVVDTVIKIVLANDDEYKDLKKEVGEKVDTNWKQAKPLIEDIKKLDDSIVNAWKLNKDLMKKVNETANVVQNLVTEITKLTDANINYSRQKGDIISFSIFIISLLSVGALSGLLFFGIKRRFSKIINMLKNIAKGEGDLTKRLEEKTGDEFGEVAKWFNLFVIKIKDIIIKMSEDAEKLRISSNDMAQLSIYISQRADDMTQKSNNVSTSSEELSSNLIAISEAMKQASGNINLVSVSAEEITSTINEIASNSEKAKDITEDAVNKVNKASENINNLGTSADDIGKVTETINDISDQTNLLALNATIEAARAGDTGKGFAVVAGEIKDLAKQTADATNDIKIKINSIQNSTSVTVKEIKQISNVIHDVNLIVTSIAAAVEEQSTTTKEIAGNIAHASQGVIEVERNVEQSSSFSKNISADISDFNLSITALLKDSNKVKINSQELNNLSTSLNNMVKLFKI
ncbi:MAG: methyl-accepting chemotaxis protein [Desulfobacterales bacterium]|nr:methyl-accepting chemotaxis protein [Desulfobacterales bacterium]